MHDHTDGVPLAIEETALIAAGQSAEAARLVTAFARGLRGCSAPAPHTALATCQAMLAESQGHTDRAAEVFGQASASWAALPRPYEALLAQEGQARCLMTGHRDAGLLLFTKFSAPWPI